MHDTIVPMTLAEMSEILISGGKGMKKRWFSALLMGTMILSLAACGGAGSSSSKDGSVSEESTESTEEPGEETEELEDVVVVYSTHPDRKSVV